MNEEPRSAEPQRGELRQKNLTTADPVASAQEPRTRRNDADPPVLQDAVEPADRARQDNAAAADRAAPARGEPAKDEETNLAPLFAEDVAGDFRSRWDAVQRGFVDDPQGSVRAGDELVAQVIKSLAETFSGQRAALEDSRADQASTENLRLALRRYRSFFERLLSI
jgi:hypothetical protein